MNSVAFLTTELAPHYVTDDHLAVPLLRGRGVEVSFVSWRDDVDWAAIDLVVVRSTWDYQRHLPDFLATLESIAAVTRLENPLALQRWNVRKTYLRDLAAAGIPIVPTLWREAPQPGDLAGAADELGAAEVVLKPVVGASGEDAFRVPAADFAHREGDLLRRFQGRPLMIQPFLAGVLEKGEESVVWIDGAFSHALRKVPRPGEFRSQEEHGGDVRAIRPEPSLMEAAARVLTAVDGRAERPPLYGRVDFLPGPDGEWLLGELELVEPSLYLRLDDDAAARFADAIVRRLEGAPPGRAGLHVDRSTAQIRHFPTKETP